MQALRGKMRNYGFSDDEEKEKDEAQENQQPNPQDLSTPPKTSAKANDSETPVSKPSLRHHPMVVFPAAPLFAEKVFPLVWVAAPLVKVR